VAAKEHDVPVRQPGGLVDEAPVDERPVAAAEVVDHPIVVGRARDSQVRPRQHPVRLHYDFLVSLSPLAEDRPRPMVTARSRRISRDDFEMWELTRNTGTDERPRCDRVASRIVLLSSSSMSISARAIPEANRVRGRARDYDKFEPSNI
jgi:hypothetical protein